MYRSTILIICVMTFAAAAFKIPDDHSAIINPAITGILECRFDDVLRLTDSAYLSNNKNPLAAVLHLAALGMRDIDFDTPIDTAAFMRSFERAKNAVNEYEKVNGTDSYLLTLRGFVLGMNASFRLKNGSYIAAASTGLDAMKAMKGARELDSANTEVNFFLGLYDYARADLKKRLGAAMFWYPGDKASGIRLLEQGAQSARLTGTAAKLALSDIYLAEGQAQKSRDIIYSLKKELANSRFLLWAEVKYFEGQKMFSQAAAAYGRLADSYGREPHGAYNGAVTRNRQAHMYHKAGEKALAASTCRLILDGRGGDDTRTGAIIKDTEKLLKRLER
ncbi:MAG: hypothetical protein FWC23_00595 [Chitinispirillia bacterium]|nr:hypothetical protein [Chitinispirillia bacterium]MCL2219848.1 hypothetical protein [Chitinispirillia bacterium]MCL2267673.1 hypothetical protein [Chitinispirillia bacterium]